MVTDLKAASTNMPEKEFSRSDEARARFEAEFEAWLAEMEREIEATRESERITAEDLAIIVY